MAKNQYKGFNFLPSYYQEGRDAFLDGVKLEWITTRTLWSEQEKAAWLSGYLDVQKHGPKILGVPDYK